jgi:PAS domain S-box-containing protein
LAIDSTRGSDAAFPTGGGNMGALIRARDWSASPLGAPDNWPQSLRSAVQICLSTPIVGAVHWGPDLRILYNDAYAPALAERHPWALGQPFGEVWAEIWDVLGPQIASVRETGRGFSTEHQLLRMHRNGQLRDTYWIYSFAPLHDDGGEVAGVFVTALDTTDRVVAERRLIEEQERQHQMLRQMPGFVGMLSGPDLVYTYVNDAYVTISERTDFIGRRFRDVFADIEGQGFFEAFESAFHGGKGVVIRGMELRLHGRHATQYVDFVLEPIREDSGAVVGLFVGGYETTEVYRGNAALRESEGRFRALVNATANVVFRMGPDWREMLRLDGAGFIADTKVPTANWIGIYIPADEQLRIRDTVTRAIAAKGVFELEHQVRRVDGTIGWMLSRAVPLFNDASEIVEWFGAASDVTERVKADESFTRLFQASPAPFLVLAADAPRFTIREVNEAYLAATMSTRESIVGRGVFEAFPDNPDDPAVQGVNTLRASLERVLATREPDRLPGLKYDVAGPNGDFEERWWSPVNSPVLNARGEVEALIHNANDVTDERRTEAALRASESRLRELNETLESQVRERTAELRLHRDIIESNASPIVAFDAKLRVIVFNKAHSDTFRRMFGRNAAVGDVLPDLFPADQAASLRGFMARALAGEVFSVIEAFGDPDLSKPYFELHYAPLREEGGHIIGAFHYAQDITARLRAEVELTQAQEALRQSQKMEAMGSLTGGVAHDFNNLLTPIVGVLDMLERKGIGGEREQRLIGGAAQSAERARVLVQRLLAFARRQPLQPVPVDVPALVRNMAGLVASTTGPQIDVVVEADDALAPAKADPNQLEMALLNLAVNARDAMPDGGTLRISVSADAVGYERDAKLPPGRYVRVSVADTGSGMDEATLARATEPFFSTKGVGKGTGLGLSMVHGLASQLGGALMINSKPGLGTNIELWLPQTEAVVPEPSMVMHEAAPPSGCGTALLVDDEELVRLSTADMLGDLGYQVVEAGSAEEALRVIESGAHLDVVVTDHLMPGMTGTDLARAVRDRRPELPVLIVSGYAEVDGVAPDLPRLTKPFRKNELAASLAGLEGMPR